MSQRESHSGESAQRDLRSASQARPRLSLVNLVGWLTVVLATSATTFWTFWGTIEAFHEGWWQPRLGMRLLQLMAYLAPASVLAALTFVGLRWPRVGAALLSLVGVAIGTLIFIDRARMAWDIWAMLTAVPVVVGLMFFYGRPRPLAAAYIVALGIPVLTLVVCGVEPVYRVSRRFDDGNLGTRRSEGRRSAGESFTLLWAPDGPGWSRQGNVPWSEALRRVRHLTEDGTTLASEPQNIWRLPTREEVVCSLTRGNVNAGGRWDAARQRATYQRKPDKESPLWDVYSPLIYLWTSEDADEQQAWIVVYHGGIFPKDKRLGSASLGFRAVREVSASDAVNDK